MTGSGSPTNSNRSEHRSHVRRKSTLTGEAGKSGDDDDFGDDFDEFEEGEQAAGDDFGEFDAEFEEPSPEEESDQPVATPVTPVPSYVSPQMVCM